MKQYKFTIIVRTHLDIKEILWAFASKLKDAFHIISIDYTEVDERPTSIEHHGGDLDKLDDCNPRPEEEIANYYNNNNIPERY